MENVDLTGPGYFLNKNLDISPSKNKDDANFMLDIGMLIWETEGRKGKKPRPEKYENTNFNKIRNPEDRRYEAIDFDNQHNQTHIDMPHVLERRDREFTDMKTGTLNNCKNYLKFKSVESGHECYCCGNTILFGGGIAGDICPRCKHDNDFENTWYEICKTDTEFYSPASKYGTTSILGLVGGDLVIDARQTFQNLLTPAQLKRKRKEEKRQIKLLKRDLQKYRAGELLI